jgi:hypothetical protein
MPSMVPGAKRLIEDGISVPGFGNVAGQTYESNVPFLLRLIILFISLVL